MLVGVVSFAADARTLASLHRALTLSYKIIERLTSVLKSKNLSSGFPIVLNTIQLKSVIRTGCPCRKLNLAGN